MVVAPISHRLPNFVLGKMSFTHAMLGRRFQDCFPLKTATASCQPALQRNEDDIFRCTTVAGASDSPRVPMLSGLADYGKPAKAMPGKISHRRSFHRHSLNFKHNEELRLVQREIENDKEL
jgi:hypothetical protein